MTISTNKPIDDAPVGGVFVDGLTLVRLTLVRLTLVRLTLVRLTLVSLLIMPVIMALILWNWPDPQIAILTTFLFIIAALTDIFDDWFGGSSRRALRRYGWLDDIADTLLTIGILIALSYMLYRNGYMRWAFAVPVGIIMFREILIGLIKGYELSRYGCPDNKLSNAKGGFAILGSLPARRFALIDSRARQGPGRNGAGDGCL